MELVWRFRVVLFAVVGSAVLFWRRAVDPFATPKATLVVVLAVIAAALTVVSWLRQGSVRVSRTPFTLGVLVLAAAMILVTVTSEYPLISLVGQPDRWTGLIPYLAYLALGLVAARHSAGRQPDQLILTLLVTAGIVTAYALIQDFGLDPLDWTRAIGSFSTIGNTNFTAAYMGSIMPLALHEAMTPGGTWRRWASGLLAAASLVALGGSAAIQGQIVAAVGTGVVLVFHAVTRTRVGPWLRDHLRPAAVGSLVAVLALIVVATAYAPPLERILGGNYQSVRARVLFYEAALGMWRDHPLLGTGLDTFGSFFSRYQPAEHAAWQPYSLPAEPHSVPLGMLSDGGIVLGGAYIGVVLLVGVLWIRAVAMSTGHHRSVLLGLGVVWLGYQLQSLVSIDEPPLAVLHWVLAGMIAGLASSSSPDELSLKLPWAPPPSDKRRGRRRPRPLPPPARAAIAAVLVVGTVAAWSVTRPLRADLAAARAGALARGAEIGGDRQFVAALDELDRAQRLAPWEASYYALESQYRHQLGDLPGAMDAYLMAARFSPGSPRTALTTAGLALAVGDSEGAITWLEEAVAMHPRAPATLMAAASYYSDMGESERATALAERVLDLDPDSEDALALLRSLSGSS